MAERVEQRGPQRVDRADPARGQHGLGRHCKRKCLLHESLRLYPHLQQGLLPQALQGPPGAPGQARRRQRRRRRGGNRGPGRRGGRGRRRKAARQAPQAHRQGRHLPLEHRPLGRKYRLCRRGGRAPQRRADACPPGPGRRPRAHGRRGRRREQRREARAAGAGGRGQEEPRPRRMAQQPAVQTCDPQAKHHHHNRAPAGGHPPPRRVRLPVLNRSLRVAQQPGGRKRLIHPGPARLAPRPQPREPELQPRQRAHLCADRGLGQLPRCVPHHHNRAAGRVHHPPNHIRAPRPHKVPSAGLLPWRIHPVRL
eukprot:comp20974_c0_seq1/m.43873 comp20974_c0_seq1/g.43873  ORF comp20974_c0_seq1/g.43873 comp20974_c0_seq1/m.43873 type:complete len:310 (-) comp20974_c0_seq1:375-1304(-)